MNMTPVPVQIQEGQPASWWQELPGSQAKKMNSDDAMSVYSAEVHHGDLRARKNMTKAGNPRST